MYVYIRLFSWYLMAWKVMTERRIIDDIRWKFHYLGYVKIHETICIFFNISKQNFLVYSIRQWGFNHRHCYHNFHVVCHIMNMAIGLNRRNRNSSSFSAILVCYIKCLQIIVQLFNTLLQLWSRIVSHALTKYSYIAVD
jgi:hypothetical protein